MSIKSVQLTNFQSHSDSTLEFSEGVNIILGASDSGKTAIIRAIRWALLNKPSGDEMRSNWGGDTEVSVCTTNQYICRKKTKRDGSEYILDGLSFKAFGTDVPKEIQDAFNMSSVNLQAQLDSPFLLSETPGNVASFFNGIAGLSKIDTATSNINSAIRELTSDIKYAEAQEKELQGRVEKFSHLEKFEADVEVLEQMENQLSGSRKIRERLMDWCCDYQETNTAINVESEYLQYEEAITQIFQWKDEVREQETHREKLNFLLNQIDSVEQSLSGSKTLTACEGSVNTLLDLYKDLNTAEDSRNKLFKAVKAVNSTNTVLEQAQCKYDALHASFEKAFPVGSLCPLCNKPK